MDRASFFCGLFEAYAGHSLATRCSSVFSGFPVERVDHGFFIVHEKYLGAVALTGWARGDHIPQLASYFLVRSPTALRLLSGEQLVYVLAIPDYVEDICLVAPLRSSSNP